MYYETIVIIVLSRNPLAQDCTFTCIYLKTSTWKTTQQTSVDYKKYNMPSSLFHVLPGFFLYIFQPHPTKKKKPKQQATKSNENKFHPILFGNYKVYIEDSSFFLSKTNHMMLNKLFLFTFYLAKHYFTIRLS